MGDAEKPMEAEVSELEGTITGEEIDRLVEELTDPESKPQSFKSFESELNHALCRLEEKKQLVNC
ncbi:MAG: hypothetical protein ABH919_02330 [bacterium]